MVLIRELAHKPWSGDALDGIRTVARLNVHIDTPRSMCAKRSAGGYRPGQVFAQKQHSIPTW